jgi:transposase
MILDSIPAERIYVALGHTDMRRSIDGLSVLVQQTFKLDPFSNSLYLFSGRRGDRLKALYWEGDGFILFYKRLERGRFRWPRSEADVRQVTPQQLRWLLEGLSIDQRSAIAKISSVQIT